MPAPEDALPLERLLDAALRRGAGLTLACISIDRSGTVRDAHGSSVAVHLVAELRRVVEGNAPEGTIARVLDDRHLAVILPLDLLDVRSWVLDIVRDGRMELPLGDGEVCVELSVGLAASREGQDADVLVDEVRAALRVAERGGPGHVAVYDDGIRAEAADRLALEAELRQAVATDSLRLALEPVVARPGGVAVGADAVLRWTTSWGASVPPAVTAEVVERSGLGTTVGRWTIGRAAALAARGHGWVSVSLTPSQLSGSLPYIVRQAMAQHGTDPAALQFVVSTRELLRLPGAAAVLVELRELGVGIGLDADVVPTTEHLRTLRVDFIRLHRDIVAGTAEDPTTRAVVAAWVGVGRALDIEIVASGVDGQAQADALAELGILLHQGSWPGMATQRADASH